MYVNTKYPYLVLFAAMFYCFCIDSAIGQDNKLLKAIHVNDAGIRWWADLTVEGNKISGILNVFWNQKRTKDIKCRKVKIKNGGKFKLWCKGKTSRNRSLSGNLEAARLSPSGAAGGAIFRFVSGSELENFLSALESNPDLTTDQFLKN